MAAYPYRTAVDAAAASKALVEATTVFAELGIATPTDAQTAQMEIVIGQASALISSYVDRQLAEEDVTDHFRQPIGDTLQLSRFPVSNILQVMESGAEITPDDWELDDVTGQLWRISGTDRADWSCSGNTTVTYTGGYFLPDDLPTDIQRAAIDQAKAMFMGGGRDPTVRSFQVPDVYQASYSVPGGDSFGKSGLLIQVEGALAPYCRWIA